jgi:hypothetical protein
VTLLQTAAGKAGCEAVLALADIKTTHSAFPADEGYGYRRRWDDAEVSLTHWTAPDGTRLEETSLFADGTEVCASTPSGDLTPVLA